MSYKFYVVLIFNFNKVIENDTWYCRLKILHNYRLIIEYRFTIKITIFIIQVHCSTTISVSLSLSAELSLSGSMFNDLRIVSLSSWRLVSMLYLLWMKVFRFSNNSSLHQVALTLHLISSPPCWSGSTSTILAPILVEPPTGDLLIKNVLFLSTHTSSIDQL